MKSMCIGAIYSFVIVPPVGCDSSVLTQEDFCVYSVSCEIKCPMLIIYKVLCNRIILSIPSVEFMERFCQ